MMRSAMRALLVVAVLGSLGVVIHASAALDDWYLTVSAEELIAKSRRLTHRGLHGGAELALREALSIAPDLPRAHGLLGQSLVDQGRLREALPHLRLAAKANTAEVSFMHELAHLYVELGDTEEAVRWLRRNIDEYPYDAIPYTMLAGILVDQGRVEEAVAAARRGVELGPLMPEAHLNLGLALWGSGDLDAALAAFDEELRLRPGDARATSSRDAVLEEMEAVPEPGEQHATQ